MDNLYKSYTFHLERRDISFGCVWNWCGKWDMITENVLLHYIIGCGIRIYTGQWRWICMATYSGFYLIVDICNETATFPWPGLFIMFHDIANNRKISNYSQVHQPFISKPSITNTQLKLTHWGRDKMAAISQTTFSNEFSWINFN